MSHPNRRHITVILDRSGSMHPIRSDVEGGLTAFFAAQESNPAETLVSLYQFDHRYKSVYEYRPLADLPDFRLVPEGRTALLDAIGMTITRMREHFDTMPESEQPGEIIVVIITDGHENASSQWRSRTKIRHLIEEQTARGWKFHYLDATPDAFTKAASYGIPRETTLQFGTDHTLDALTRAGRVTSHGEDGFSSDDRDATRY
ncbi:vWA domain-containing protein [Nonomuraea sp. NPDC048892]|uniref:vWA domain-containing protein n=1 Tax=Nonomuraea sp. NPDC048892 TaxID=3154624 RepID=UPI0033C01040